MKIKTPLRYPGGKSRAVNKIIPLIPDFDEFREPFVGGASIFIAARQKCPDKKYWINDINTGLYFFWLFLKEDSLTLVKKIQNIKNAKRDGKKLFNSIVSDKQKSGFENAVDFFVLNRITFSGTTEAGGYSQTAFKERFTQSSIDRLQPVSSLLDGVKVTNFDYEKVVTAGGSGVFIFLDPPYVTATKSRLYGKNGRDHEIFDHQRFSHVMKNVKHKWLITYDNCEEVRDMFSFANIYEWELQYGMNNVGKKTAAKGKELIITNYKLDL